MNTIENNKLIVDFLEWTKVRYINDIEHYYLPYGFEFIKEVETTIESNWCEILQEQDTCTLKEMKFLISWDWLMPVICKITSLDNYIKYIDYSSSIVGKGGVYIDIKFISVTYQNVIEFIKWYNENKL